MEDDENNLDDLQDPQLDHVESETKWVQDSPLDDGVKLFLGAVFVVLGSWAIWWICMWFYDHIMTAY